MKFVGRWRVKVTPRGVDGRLQAILRAHENEMGDFVLHLDGLGRMIFLMLVAGGGAIKGSFTPRARWDIAGQGEWHDNTIRLTSLSTGFDQAAAMAHDRHIAKTGAE